MNFNGFMRSACAALAGRLLLPVVSQAIVFIGRNQAEMAKIKKSE